MAGSFFSWFQVVSVSFRWFQVVPCFSKCAFDNFNLGDFNARSIWNSGGIVILLQMKTLKLMQLPLHMI